MSPEISVVIPAYNAAKYVAEAVESALGQTLPPLEVIVVDDGSTDETEAVLRPYGGRIRYVRQPNGGPAVARNRGIRESRGEWIAFLDADDVWFPEKLEKQWKRLQAHPGAGLVHTDNYWLIESTGERVPERAPGREGRGRCYGQMLLWNGVTLSTAMVKRECLDRVGWFDESIRAASSEDYDLCLRLSRHHEFAFVDEPLALHREHSSNATKARLTMLTNELFVVRKSLRDDPELSRLVGRRNVRDRLFDLHFGIGYLHHDAGRRAEARACFRQALAIRPWRPYPAFLYAMNLLPAPWARTLRRHKAKLA